MTKPDNEFENIDKKLYDAIDYAASNSSYYAGWGLVKDILDGIESAGYRVTPPAEAPSDGQWACGGHGDKFNGDCDECCWARRCNEYGAKISKLEAALPSHQPLAEEADIRLVDLLVNAGTLLRNCGIERVQGVFDARKAWDDAMDVYRALSNHTVGGK